MSTRTIGLGALALRSTLLALLGLALAGTPAALASPGDYDGDGTPNAQDCAPLDPAVHRGAVDRPDLAFEDSNCDGIDGDQAKAIFVAPGGRDLDAGTLTRPKRTLAAAIGAAQTQGKDVYLAGGTYPGSATLASGVGLYGGYEVITGRRDVREVTTITGTPQGALADGATSVVLQLLTLSGSSQGAGGSAYGLRAINGSEVVLQRVVSSAGDGRPGAAGTPGTSGGSGSAGDQGDDFEFDGATANGGSAGGGANAGGAGGNGRSNQSGQDGHDGFTSTGDGAEGGGGTGGQPTGAPGLDGVAGDDGTDGAGGGGGAAGTFSTASAGARWAGRENASDGSTGRGGGGGGGGGAGTGAPNCGGPGLNVPSGNAGGGGGGGGYGGTGGTAGRDGGGSFALYAYRSRVVVSDSTLKTGDGGAGGAGAPGGAGGIGGTGGAGRDYPGYENPCFPHFDDPASQIVGDGGAGGAGGAGGTGGTGGGGAGGPSVAVFATGTGATFTFAKPSRFQLGDEGDGGAGSAQGDSGLSGRTIGAQQSSTTADLDGDDVADAADDCPGVAGARPSGCPARPARFADTDGDGIPDGQDGCPSVAGAPADGGCPPLPAPPPPPADADHDGSPAGQDCDDADPAIHPGAAEIRGNAVDENCDGIVARNLANPAKLARPAFTAARKGDGRTLRALAASKLPAGSTVVVSCSGRHCPFKSRALTGPRRGGTVDIRRKLTTAQRALHKGEVLTVRVTAPGYRVKFARYPVR